MIFSSEFKEAISNLSPKEKDRLLFRLLKKDLILVNQLHFELLETKSIEEKRKEIENNIKNDAKRAMNTFYSPGYLLVDVRYMSGNITEFTKIHKDKYGEVSLNLLMLNETLKLNNEKLCTFNYAKTLTFYEYVINRTFKVLLLIKKMHEDIHLDFKAELETLGSLLGKNHELMKMAIHKGLDVNWLINFEVPENIALIHKDLKEKGYVK